MIASLPDCRSLLSFACNGLLFALDVSCVEEMLWLPELLLIEECPPFVVGLVNRHGTLLPVLDLAARLGHRQQRSHCSDSLIVVKVPQRPNLPPLLKSPVLEVGIIATDLLEVFEVSGQDIEIAPFAITDLDHFPRMVAGRVKVDGEVLMLLDPGLLFESDAEPAVGEPGTFFPEAKAAEREIFHRRSLELLQIPPMDDALRTGFAVMRWGKEYVCVELESVVEFSTLAQRVPVPCCPAHVVGNMNLRGKVLTLVDLRGVLEFPPSPISDSSKVVVAEFGGFPVGILADEVLEVTDLAAIDIVRAPLPSRPYAGDFVRGVTPYGDQMMTVLNLREILSWEGLAVNEEV